MQITHQESYQRKREICDSGKIFEGEKYPNVWNAVFLLPTQAGAILTAPRDCRPNSTRTDFVLLYDE